MGAYYTDENPQPKCAWGYCSNYLICKKAEETTEACQFFKPCLSYMDKYANDMEIWKEYHE